MTPLTAEVHSIFAVNGWTVQDENPLRILHDDSGDVATGQAAEMVAEQLFADIRAEGSCVPDCSSTTEAFAELVQLATEVRRLADVARQRDGQAGAVEAWAMAYELVFGRNVSQRVNALMARLDQSFQHSEPDAGTCRDDVCAYEHALGAHVAKMQPFFSIRKISALPG